MVQNWPNWLQAAVVALGVIAAVVAFGIHLQDDVDRNHHSIERLHVEVKEVDDIVRDSQQRLAHIEAILESSQQPNAARAAHHAAERR